MCGPYEECVVDHARGPSCRCPPPCQRVSEQNSLTLAVHECLPIILPAKNVLRPHWGFFFIIMFQNLGMKASPGTTPAFTPTTPFHRLCVVPDFNHLPLFTPTTLPIQLYEHHYSETIAIVYLLFLCGPFSIPSNCFRFLICLVPCLCYCTS